MSSSVLPSRIRSLRLQVFVGLGCAAAMVSGASGAQAQALGRLLACQDIARAEERLQCYDSAARTAIGIGAQPVRSADETIARREEAVAAREAKLAEREALVKKLEAAVRDLKTKVVAKSETVEAVQSASVTPARNDEELGAREAALAAREAALAAREQKVASLPPADSADSATLFGIPIPFSRKDSFNDETDKDGMKVERDSDGDVDAINAPIREWSLTAEGMLIVVLDNGQVWRQTDGDNLRLKQDEANPNIARISRAALGSFMMTVNGSAKSVKVRRVDGRKSKS